MRSSVAADSQRAAPTTPPSDVPPTRAPESEATAAPSETAEGRRNRPVIRYFRKCTAMKAEALTDKDKCTFETKRYPKARRAELEFQEHALKAHSEPGQKRVVVKREEIDA